MKPFKHVHSITRVLLAAAGIACVLLTTGCWDDAEINGRAFVLGFGADNSTDAGNYLFTFQLAIPVSGESESSGSIEYTDCTVKEQTPAAAVRTLEKNLGRQINFEQLNLIVIGEELSQGDFIGLTDYFFRRASVRRQSCIAVCSGNARDFFASSSTDKAVSTDAAVTLQSYDAGGSKTSMDLHTLYKTLINRDEFYLLQISPIAADASENPSENEKKVILSITGASAYGREGNYRGNITEDELELMRLACGSATSGALAVYDDAGQRYCCQVRQSDCSTKCSIVDNKPQFRLQMDLVLVPLDSPGSDTGAYTNQFTRHIGECAERTVSRRLNALADRSRQALGSSVLGLRDIVRQRHPDWYELHGEELESIYSSSEIIITVNCTVAGGGITK